jgi:sodium transport system permease protein
MTLANVKLILAREIRDQLRDRRTLFVILVLPILLYPLLGMSFTQVYQFRQEQPVRVLVLGADDWGDLPPLLGKEKQFATYLFRDRQRGKLIEVDFRSSIPPSESDPLKYARNQVQSGQCDAAIYFPADFRARMQSFRESLLSKKSADAVKRKAEQKSRDPEKAAPASQTPRIPSPEIIYTTANEKSQIAFRRLSDVMERWTEIIGESILAEAGVPIVAMQPFTLEQADVARGTSLSGAMIWAKILPAMLLLWALTGAFYPAIDLCAGEKERGTLETLLSSPAERSEIVVGKLLTIMLFSILTAVLNLLSVAVTGCLVISQIGAFGSPPPLAMLWISLALLPVAAFFSAVCLALAAFARSSKEGQYYLMPVLLLTMPLVVVPMSPGVQLNLGYSLIPITGIVLLLKTLLEGNYLLASQFAPVVIGVTLAACLLAIRWAIDQFNSESVLFSGSERLDLRLWIMRLYRDRKPTPTVAAAVSCAVLMLMLKFFMSFSFSAPNSFRGFAVAALVSQLTVILAPAIVMAIALTSKPRQTFLLKMPGWQSLVAVPAAFLLAVALHPLANLLQSLVAALYPIDESAITAFSELQQILTGSNLWLILLVVAATPAICEELAFRGFILSGFRHVGYKWRAIALTAFFFGITHGILQQSMIAFVVGLILGYIAVQSGSIWPCMVFHFTHNSLALLHSRITPELCARWTWLKTILVPEGNHATGYRWEFIVACGIVAALLIVVFSLLTYSKTPEERLQEAILRGKKSNPEDKEISIGLASMIE